MRVARSRTLLLKSSQSPDQFRSRLAEEVGDLEKTIWTDSRDRSFRGEIGNNRFKLHRLDVVVDGEITPDGEGCQVKLTVRLSSVASIAWLAVACTALVFAVTVVTAAWVHSLQLETPFRPQLKGLFLLFLPSVLVYLMMLGHLQDGVQSVSKFFRGHLSLRCHAITQERDAGKGGPNGVAHGDEGSPRVES